MTKYRSILAVALIMGAILVLVFIARLGLVNLGMLAYSKAVMPGTAGPVLDTYAQGELLADRADAQAAVNYLMVAQKLGQPAIGQWALARSEMAVGKMENAAEILQDLRKIQPTNSLLYQDLLVSLSQAGKSQEIISLFEETPPVHRTLVMSDTVAGAYLEVAQLQDNTTAQSSSSGAQWNCARLTYS